MNVELLSQDLHYNAETKTFSAEASSLGFAPGEWPAKLAVKSARTGNVVRFRPSVTETRKGEMVAQVYVCIDMPEVQLRVIND